MQDNKKTIGIIGINENTVIFLDYCKKYQYKTIILNDKLISCFNEKCDKLIIGSFFSQKVIEEFFSSCDLVYLAEKKINFYLFHKYIEKFLSFDKNIWYYQQNLLLEQEFLANTKLNILPFSSLENENSLLIFKNVFDFPFLLKQKLLTENENEVDKTFLITSNKDFKKLKIFNYHNFFVKKYFDSFLISLTFMIKNEKIIALFWSKTTFLKNSIIKTEKYLNQNKTKIILKNIRHLTKFLKNNVLYTLTFKELDNNFFVENISCFIEKSLFWTLKNKFNPFDLLLKNNFKNIKEKNNFICYFVIGKYYYLLFDFLMKNPNIIFKDYLKDNFEETKIVGHFLVLNNDLQNIKKIKEFLNIN